MTSDWVAPLGGIRIIEEKDFLSLNTLPSSGSNLFAMYSSYWSAIILNPALMLVPVDDHLVHRGDGVFETLKCVNGGLYNLEAHLRRLEKSCATIALDLPFSVAKITEIILETIQAGGRKDCLLRVMISRGPGSMGINPADCPDSQLYVVVYAPGVAFMEQKPEGASVGVSQLPIKSGVFATIKSCNYLQNVLLKKETSESDYDFLITLDEEGYVAEGSTENIAIVTEDNWLVSPTGDRSLEGTTLLRSFELAEKLVVDGLLNGIKRAKIRPSDLEQASEIMLFSTTLDVTEATKFCGKRIKNGQFGPIYEALSPLIRQDLFPDAPLITPAFTK